MADLGLLGFDGFDFAVANLPRSRQFYVERMDFAEVERATPELVERTGQETSVFEAGEIRVAVSSPNRASAPLAAYLSRHPAGVTGLAFSVKSLDRAWQVLAARGATFLGEPTENEVEGGLYRAFEIATPLGEVAFRFVERRDFSLHAPGFEALPLTEPTNQLGFRLIDHVTSNAVTMMPVVLWYREVLGFEHYWDIQFHTADMKKGPRGSGLKSIVMWDPESKIKLATNEPLRPYFFDSQINVFVQQNGGPGVQHIALRVPALIPVVDELTRRGVQFLATPPTYYEMLPDRLARVNVSTLKEPVEELARLGILVDGADDRYLLQIFLREASALYRDERAGPFFYEIIQRAGHNGFGEGNFRALFEAIEREQFMAYQSPIG
ncbi:MAG: VOC family protein [Candidatus Rokubacteria bacterium]|nr:VOC family protein [Candidatus Rokubacteria bacterium]